MRATFEAKLAKAFGNNVSREQQEDDRRTLVAVGIKSKRSMMAAIASPVTPPRVLTIIAWLLGRWPTTAGRAELVRATAELLRHRRSEVRQEAAISLGLLGTSRALGVLMTAIRDRDEEVRKRVLSGLGLQEHDEDAYRAIVAVLRDRKEVSSVRAHAAEALANFAESRSASVLVEALSDSAPEVRLFAAHALGELRAAAAVPALRAVSRSDRAEVRGFGSVRSEASAALRKIIERR